MQSFPLSTPVLYFHFPLCFIDESNDVVFHFAQLYHQLEHPHVRSIFRAKERETERERERSKERGREREREREREVAPQPGIPRCRWMPILFLPGEFSSAGCIPLSLSRFSFCSNARRPLSRAVCSEKPGEVAFIVNDDGDRRVLCDARSDAARCQSSFVESIAPCGRILMQSPVIHPGPFHKLREKGASASLSESSFVCCALHLHLYSALLVIRTESRT